MVQEWKIIREFENLSLRSQFNSVLLTVIFGLVSVIIYQDKTYKEEIKRLYKEKNEINNHHIQYIEKSERELRIMEYDIKRLKDK